MSRRFYRLVSEMEPPLDDLRSQAEQGRVYDDAEVQRRAEEVSVVALPSSRFVDSSSAMVLARWMVSRSTP